MDDLELPRLEGVPAQAWEALADALNVLNKEKEVPKTEYTEYDDGPWATGGSDSLARSINVDVAGHWHFPGPDVSNEPELKLPIYIVPLKQGFAVEVDDSLGYENDVIAFTDAFDMAEWLLEWLGMAEAIIIDSPLHEMVETDHQRALDVARAAQAYVEECGCDYDSLSDAYNQLAEAVKKWRETKGG